MNLVTEAVVKAFDQYIAEFSGDGYRREDFIDFVVAEIIPQKKRRPWGSPGMIRFYKEHARKLERDMRLARKRLAASKRKRNAAR